MYVYTQVAGPISDDTDFQTICKEYTDIKTYQFMLNRSFECQATASISNTTILSIIYMLQQAGESLQEIQVSSVDFQ